MAQNLSPQANAHHHLVMGLVLAVLLLCVGCATTNRDSDLPWNMQQPWESAPSIPGFNNQ
ncbi:MAG: hypothetical protein EPN23_05200 [Verrucomicrobia bacterium]|nr:MAG: hypothetical protein EPN23_05200 [Verrucomicrobiota bacterium]